MRGYPERTLATRAKWLLDTREDVEVSATEWVAEMEAILRELANAPESEPEPLTDSFAQTVPDKCDRVVWRGHYYHLKEGTEKPAPSVPDDFYNAVANLSVELEELVAETSGVYGLHLNGDPSPWEEILEGGRFERISSLHVVQNLLATRQPKQPEQPAQPADLVRDAERYRWLRTYNTAKHTAVTEAFFLGDESLDAGIDAAIAAEKGGAA